MDKFYEEYDALFGVSLGKKLDAFVGIINLYLKEYRAMLAKENWPAGQSSNIPILVERDSKTSNRIKNYLSAFWEVYQTSPVLQKVLENA